MTSQFCSTLSEQFLLTLQYMVIDTKIYRGSVPFPFNYKSTLKIYLLKPYNIQQNWFISLSHMFHLPIHYFSQFIPSAPQWSLWPLPHLGQILVSGFPQLTNLLSIWVHSWAKHCLSLDQPFTFEGWDSNSQLQPSEESNSKTTITDRNSHILSFFHS